MVSRQVYTNPAQRRLQEQKALRKKLLADAKKKRMKAMGYEDGEAPDPMAPLGPAAQSKVRVLAGQGMQKLRAQIAVQAAARGRAVARKKARKARLRAMKSAGGHSSPMDSVMGAFRTVGKSAATKKLGILSAFGKSKAAPPSDPIVTSASAAASFLGAVGR